MMEAVALCDGGCCAHASPRCVSPSHGPGRVALEYSPSGALASATNSKRRKIRFTFYEARVDSMVPRRLQPLHALL